MALEGSPVLIQREKKKKEPFSFLCALLVFFLFSMFTTFFFFSSVCTHACVCVSVFGFRFFEK